VFAQAHAGGDTNDCSRSVAGGFGRGHTKMQLPGQLIILRSAPGNPSLSHYKCKTAKLSEESNMFSIQRLMPAATSRGAGTTIDCVYALVPPRDAP